MSHRSDNLQVAATPEQVRHTLLGIASNGEWDVRQRKGDIRLVERRHPSVWQTNWKAKIRVSWRATNEGTSIHLDGRIAGAGPFQSRHLLGRMGALRAALEHQLSAPSPASHNQQASPQPTAQPPKFDTVTGRPIISYDPQTGEPILGEHTDG